MGTEMIEFEYPEEEENVQVYPLTPAVVASAPRANKRKNDDDGEAVKYQCFEESDGNVSL